MHGFWGFGNWNMASGKIKFCRWLILIVLALLPLFILPRFFTDTRVMYMVHTNSIYESVTFEYTGGKKIGCYLENPENSDGICYVFLPSFADPDRIGVEVSTVDRVDFVTDRESISVWENEPKVCSFEADVLYEMVFYQHNGDVAWRKPVMFLKSGKLPTIYVTTESGSMQSLNADKTYKEKGYVELLDAEGNVLLSDELTGISGRGNQTFSFPKKSYQIDLKTPADVLGMGTSETWILLCNVYEPTYVRNKYTYDMAMDVGMEGSPASEYVDVYFNGIYSGMYLLTEKVEFGENRLEYDDLESANRELNGDKLGSRATYLSEDETMKGTVLYYNPQDITGGYLLEHDYGEKFDDVVSGFVTSRNERYSLKNPKHASQQELEYISGLMQEIEDAIFSEDGYNPTTGKHFTEYIDLESWADKYIVEELTRNNGGGSTSSYFYKPADSVSTKVFGGPVWDYDKAYGRSEHYNKNTRDLAFLTLHVQYTSWFYQLYQHEEFVDAVKSEYRKKFSDYLTNADAQIDEYIGQIRQSYVLDWARFEHVYRSLEFEKMTLDEHVDYMKEFIRERKEFLDEVWLEDAPICLVRFLDENGSGNRSVGVIQGECIQTLPVPDTSGRAFTGWQIVGTDEFLTVDTSITEDMEVICICENAQE